MYVCVDHRPVQSWEEAAGAQEDGAHWKHGASLIDPVEVSSGHVGHTDSTGRAVQELVAISEGETEKERER